MINLNIIVEGQTEETFVNDILAPHFSNKLVFVHARKVETSRKQEKVFRGGLLNYIKAKNDIIRWIKQYHTDDWYFTTMFDLYRLPSNFPDYFKARNCRDLYRRIEILEYAFTKDISHPRNRFIPYIQLFEFEALILSEPNAFIYKYLNQFSNIKRLEKIANKFQNPEFINDDMPPSKRIKEIFGDYQRIDDGPIIAMEIGLNTIRSKCPHFNDWITKLETLTIKATAN
jgi:hypothetical protein